MRIRPCPQKTTSAEGSPDARDERTMESARLYQDITHLPGITVRHVCPDGGGGHTIIASGLSRHGVDCGAAPYRRPT